MLTSLVQCNCIRDVNESLDLFSHIQERNFLTSENQDYWPPIRPLPAVSCADPPVTSTDCPAASGGGHGDFLACRSGADDHCASLVALPSRFATFRAHHRRLCRSSAVALGSCHQTGTASGLASDRPPFMPPPAIQLRSR